MTATIMQIRTALESAEENHISFNEDGEMVINNPGEYAMKIHRIIQKLS